MLPRQTRSTLYDSATGPARLAERCRACHVLITRSQARQYGNTCGDWRCRQAWLQAIWRAREESQRREREAADRRWLSAAEERDRLAAVAGISPPALPLPVPVPANLRGLTRLPASRIQAFRENLRQAIRTAMELCGPPNHAGQPLARGAGDASWTLILSTACTVCQGRCCACGGDHAYLSAETVRRYLAEHPEAREDQVFEAYNRCLREVTFENSCVYHQPDGCGLPRDMRSATCNSFECVEIRDLQRRHPELASAGNVLLVALDGDHAAVRWSVV